MTSSLFLVQVTLVTEFSEQSKSARLIILCGKICSGKSTYAKKLSEEGNYVVLSSDELMIPLEKYLCGDYDDALAVFIDFFRRKAVEIVRAGAGVIFDFGAWTRADREKVKRFFSENCISYEMHYLKVSDKVWDQHIRSRNQAVKDGKCLAYYVDDGLRAKALELFEEPEPWEYDVLIEIAK